MKVGQGDLVFCVQSGFDSGSLEARLEVSVYSGYDLRQPSCPKIWCVHFDPSDFEK